MQYIIFITHSDNKDPLEPPSRPTPTPQGAADETQLQDTMQEPFE